jgi:DNA repair protein RadA/Sms
MYRCESCGARQPRWSGRCATCDEWNTLVEEPTATESRSPLSVGSSLPRAVPLREVDVAANRPLPTGLGELDRVLGGGLWPGSVTLLGGEPGTGKSTLLLQVMAAVASTGRSCLLIAAEEAAHQVRGRAARLGADVPGVFVVEAVQMQAIEQAMSSLAPDVVVVDSVQAVCDPDLGSPPGSLAQVRGCAQSFVSLARASGAAFVLVGHVTKEGALAGPRVLEHLVDTVLTFEGDRYLALRALRAVKHRFGPTGEMGLFEMGEHGLDSVPDPSALFLGDRLYGAPGSAVAVTLEGHRPLLVEVQALIGRPSSAPRRAVTGLDPNRVALLVAVLHSRAGILVGDRDVYVSVTGGARACEPAADLAICLAIASSVLKRAVPAEVVAIGEVGLGGELRRATALEKRLAEAGRLGFEWVLAPSSAVTSSAAPPSTLTVPGEAWRSQHSLQVVRPAGASIRPSVPPGSRGARVVQAATLPEALEAALGSGSGTRLVVGTRGRSRHELPSAGAGTLERSDDRGALPRRSGRSAEGGA